MASLEAYPYGIDRSEADVTELDEVLESLEQPPENMKETANGLGRLAVALESTHIPSAFTRVYSRLSQNIEQAMEEGRFAGSEDYIDQTAGTFAWYYYRNLRPYVDYIKGEDEALDKIAQPWRLPLLDPRVRSPSTLPGLRFTLGMTTHITSRDLVASLMKSKPEMDYYGDFTKGVDREIKQTTHELAPELVPGHSLLRKVTVPFVLGMITHDRRKAWSNYWKLRTVESEAEQESVYEELDAQAEWRNKMYLTIGRAATPFAVGTEKFPDPFSQKRAA